MDRILYNYFRSSASYRVRIALNLKRLPYDYAPVHLTRDGGQQFKPEFTALNRHSLVPVLLDGNTRVTQSLAILEYLEERYPDPPLLPTGAEKRAWVRQLALAVACDIHPLNNLRVLKFLTGPLGLADEAKTRWIHHWIDSGLTAIEAELVRSPWRGAFCFGDAPTIADCCLIPQVFNAERFGVDLRPYPAIRAISGNCQALEAFERAQPSRQPDQE